MASSLNPHPNAHPLSGAYSNAFQIAAQLEARAARTLPEVTAMVQHYAMLLETRIKAKASGRPGPNAPTGDYRRSWTHEVSTDGYSVTAVVGTNKPQSRRLEYGFVGADTLGRVYNQPPYPHVGPAVEEIRPLFIVALGDTIGGDP
ncbi:HK97 gp10 family phage protein [Streptomyces sp. NBC_01275]|uniref:HK97 gp10 family phage protein n=1 Tax=Streptomyces sp. NBC_01275 TaxID=2903807 RepID=UPI00225B61A3|nr:HK97 gp10 family phage protein [Streptomyces sp. NBC_01275]MCX4761912.1 HK97 gp10 family phage protein [Streptomyces sp. NBC_01275]